MPSFFQKYDSALAEKAKDWAKECLWEHTPGMTYGQNLFMFSRNMDVTTAVIMGVDNWWRELKYHFHGTDLLLTTERLEKDVGHWTMVRFLSVYIQFTIIKKIKKNFVISDGLGQH